MDFRLVERYSTIILGVLAIAGGLVHFFPSVLTPIVQIGVGPITLQVVVGLLSIVFGALVLYESA